LPACSSEPSVGCRSSLRREARSNDAASSANPPAIGYCIRLRHQPRQLVRGGKRNLAAVLAQLRRDARQSKFFIDFLLGKAGKAPPAGKQAIFVELPAAMNGNNHAARYCAPVGRFSSAAESFFSIIGPNPRTWCNRAVLTRRRRSSSVLTLSLSCSTLHAPQDRQGRLITCEHGARRVTRTDHDGRTTVILDQYGGKLLNSPNDVVVKSDGSVWFSDPPFGIGGNYEGNAATPELPQNVYRVDGETGQASAVASDLRGPNGLCFSPDETKLYVVESRATPNRLIRVYDVINGRRLANDRVFVDAGPGTPDRFALRRRW